MDKATMIALSGLIRSLGKDRDLADYIQGVDAVLKQSLMTQEAQDLQKLREILLNDTNNNNDRLRPIGIR